MDIDLKNGLDSFHDGMKEAADFAHKNAHNFHKNYVSKVIPNFGKYGDAAKFAAEMMPGVEEYNAIREGDWTAFAISAGIDVSSFALGVVTGGAGYAALKGGSAAAKAGTKLAVKEVAKAGTKKAVKETVEAASKKIVKETAEAGAEKVVKETVEEGVNRAAKETVEAATKKVTKETVEEGAKKTVKETAEAAAKKTTKEVVESGAEKIEKTVLKVGDKIDITHFKEYLDDIVKKTSREIQPQQRELIDEALKKKAYRKLDPDDIAKARSKFNLDKPKLIKEWEENTGQKWPCYAKDVVNKDGLVIRKAGEPYDAHHIIELSTEGPNEWWNLHPASFPDEHQAAIHAADSWASKIFG